MGEILGRINRFFERIPDAVRGHRWKFWTGFLVITFFMAAGLGRVKTDASLLSYFRANDPARQAYDQYRSVFGSDEILYIVYEAKDGDVFSSDSLRAVRQLQEALLNYRLKMKSDAVSPLDHITDVTTLINVSYLEAAEDALISRDFVGRDLPETADEREILRERALNQPEYPKVYFSDDFRYGGIVIETDFNAVPVPVSKTGEAVSQSELDTEGPDEIIAFDGASPEGFTGNAPQKFKENLMADYVPFMKAIGTLIDQPLYTKHLRFYPVGTPAFMAFASEMIIGEMGLIALGALLLIITVAWLLFRSLSAVLWLSLIVVSALIWTMGAIGWSGVVMPDLIIIIVFFVLAVGVADAIHILSGYRYFRNRQHTHADALQKVYGKSALACFLTSVTTSVGFFSMIFVPIASMQKIGVFAATGVLFAFLITIIVLPLMLDLWRPMRPKPTELMRKTRREQHVIQKILQKAEAFSFHYSGWIVAVFGVLTIMMLIGAAKIIVETSTIDIIRKGQPIRKAFDLADQAMAGSDNLEILVDTGRSDGLKDPEVHSALDALQQHIERRFSDTVTNTVSIVDVAKEAFKALNNGDPGFYITPGDKDVLAQTLFLFDNANPEDRRRLVSDDYRIGRIAVRTRSLGSIKGFELMDAVEVFIDSEISSLRVGYPNLKVSVTGQLPLQMRITDYLSRSQITSFGVTFGVIALILPVVFGSLKIGLFALIPNIFPVVTAAGLMGFTGIPLDVHTLMVVPIIIGIAVDDTIHFLTHFRLEMQIHGDARRAIMHTYQEAGQAIVFTSIVLSAGFLMFLISKNQGFGYFGILNAAAIITAVIADLVLLPAVLFRYFRSPAGDFQKEGAAVSACQEVIR